MPSPREGEPLLPAEGTRVRWRGLSVAASFAACIAVLLVGGGLSLVATRQLWAIAADGTLSVGGLCNRNLAAFATELPGLLELVVGTSRSTQNGSESTVV